MTVIGDTRSSIPSYRPIISRCSIAILPLFPTLLILKVSNLCPYNQRWASNHFCSVIPIKSSRTDHAHARRRCRYIVQGTCWGARNLECVYWFVLIQTRSNSLTTLLVHRESLWVSSRMPGNHHRERFASTICAISRKAASPCVSILKARGGYSGTIHRCSQQL